MRVNNYFSIFLLQGGYRIQLLDQNEQVIHRLTDGFVGRDNPTWVEFSFLTSVRTKVTFCHDMFTNVSLYVFLFLSRMYVCYFCDYLQPTLKNGSQMSHDMTKPTKWVCAQRRLRLIWVFAGRTCHFVGFFFMRRFYCFSHLKIKGKIRQNPLTVSALKCMKEIFQRILSFFSSRKKVTMSQYRIHSI